MDIDKICKIEIEDFNDEEKTVKIKAANYAGALWIFFNNEPFARLMIDCVDGQIRACIYTDDNMDSEPDIHPIFKVPRN